MLLLSVCRDTKVCGHWTCEMETTVSLHWAHPRSVGQASVADPADGQEVAWA